MKATFNGTEKDFDIRPDIVGLFEATLPGGSAYAMLKKFTDGTWSAADVAHVLSFALHGPSKEARQVWDLVRAARRHGLPQPPLSYAPHPDVVAAVSVEGAGNYAGLAADILTAVLFRSTAPEEEVAIDAA